MEFAYHSSCRRARARTASGTRTSARSYRAQHHRWMATLEDQNHHSPKLDQYMPFWVFSRPKSIETRTTTKNHTQPKGPRSHFEQLRNPKSSGRPSSSFASSMVSQLAMDSNRMLVAVATTTATHMQNKATSARTSSTTTIGHQNERDRREGWQRPKANDTAMLQLAHHPQRPSQLRGEITPIRLIINLLVT